MIDMAFVLCFHHAHAHAHAHADTWLRHAGFCVAGWHFQQQLWGSGVCELRCWQCGCVRRDVQLYFVQPGTLPARRRAADVLSVRGMFL